MSLCPAPWPSCSPLHVNTRLCITHVRICHIYRIQLHSNNGEGGGPRSPTLKCILGPASLPPRGCLIGAHNSRSHSETESESGTEAEKPGASSENARGLGAHNWRSHSESESESGTEAEGPGAGSENAEAVALALAVPLAAVRGNGAPGRARVLVGSS